MKNSLFFSLLVFMLLGISSLQAQNDRIFVTTTTGNMIVAAVGGGGGIPPFPWQEAELG
jgi:hypothetical protein